MAFQPLKNMTDSTNNSPINLDMFRQRLKKNKWFFLISVPASFVLFVALTYTTPTYFKNVLTFAAESEKANDDYFAMTLHQPDQYDLGLGKTENAHTFYAFVPIVESDGFCADLLKLEVSTLDGKFHGTYEDYLLNVTKQDLAESLMSLAIWLKTGGFLHKSGGPAAIPAEGLISSDQAKAIAIMHKQIKAKVNRQSEQTQVDIKAQDPLVCYQVCQGMEKCMHEYMSRYNLQKKEEALRSIEQAEEALLTAAEEGKLNAEEKTKALSSFARQRALIEGQMTYRSAFSLIGTPEIKYEKAGPSHLKYPLALCILFFLASLLIVCRKELRAVLQAQ